MLTTQQKSEIIKQFGQSEQDTGSTAVQVALLTEDIKQLTDHFKKHIHDFHSKTGLMQKINKRRSLLRYLKRNNLDEYRQLISRLGIRDQV